MPKKLGCGPLAIIVIVIIGILLVGANEGIGYYFEHCDPESDDFLECILESDEEEEEPEEGTVAATGTYEYKGYEVSVTMNIPLAGGAVTGSMSGTCDGQVKGNFNGQQNGVISGKITGACAPFFINIPASADFNGTVNKTGKTVPIGFSGRGGGISHDGSMVLTYQ